MLYPLSTLLVLKRRRNEEALISLKHAQENFEKQKTSLLKLEEDLKTAQEQIKSLKQNFLHKNNLNIMFIRQNHLNKEKQILLRENLIKQEIKIQNIIYNRAQNNLKKAFEKVTKSHKEFKVLDKHFFLWQKKIQKKLAHKEEQSNDEINTTRFFLDKRKSNVK